MVTWVTTPCRWVRAGPMGLAWMYAMAASIAESSCMLSGGVLVGRRQETRRPSFDVFCFCTRTGNSTAQALAPRCFSDTAS